jgi:hypothetical protein
MIIIVKYGQSLMDLAVQMYGSASALVELANDNDLAIDADVQPGQQLIVRDAYPDSAISIFADYIKENSIVVVSGDQVDALEILVTHDEDPISTNDENPIGI